MSAINDPNYQEISDLVKQSLEFLEANAIKSTVMMVRQGNILRAAGQMAVKIRQLEDIIAGVRNTINMDLLALEDRLSELDRDLGRTR